ncbi:MAG: hypothetical protein K2F73_06630 [Ruminococcus sp.]|nr:hypothetical protein [Ruminococcus sp.]
MNEVLAIPTKGFCEILFFQSKDELLKAVDAHPNTVFPVLDGNNGIDTNGSFSDVYCAIRKSVNDSVSLGEMVEHMVHNLLTAQQ